MFYWEWMKLWERFWREKIKMKKIFEKKKVWQLMLHLNVFSIVDDRKRQSWKRLFQARGPKEETFRVELTLTLNRFKK